jgi:hypothetical protein
MTNPRAAEQELGPSAIACEIAERFIGSGANIELRRTGCARAIDAALTRAHSTLAAENAELKRIVEDLSEVPVHVFDDTAAPFSVIVSTVGILKHLRERARAALGESK